MAAGHISGTAGSDEDTQAIKKIVADNGGVQSALPKVKEYISKKTTECCDKAITKVDQNDNMTPEQKENAKKK